IAIGYDGSRKAAGIKIYLNGVLQATEVQADKLTETIRTDVPFKIGQRNTSDRIGLLHLEDMRVFERALTPIETVTPFRGERLLELLGKPPEQRTAAEKAEFFEFWLVNVDPISSRLAARLGELEQTEAGLKAVGTVAHVMAERTEAPMAYVL